MPSLESTGVARRPWRAVVLSLLTPGLGHLYAGRPGRAVLAWGCSAAGSTLGLALAMMLPALAQIVLLIALTLALIALVPWDAARVARQQSEAYQPRQYNRWYVYAGVFLFSAFVWQPVFLKQLKAHVAEAHRLPSGAMAPTLLTRDYILSVPLRGAVERGEIVVYRAPGGAFLKRVVGLPGDTIGMRDGRLTIGGRAIAEPYAQREPTDPVVPEFAWQRDYLPASIDRGVYRASRYNWGPLVVPANQYFVLGDNRSNSLDSRYVGFVSRDSIVRRPTVVYFSSDPETGAIRWRRIGRSVRR